MANVATWLANLFLFIFKLAWQSLQLLVDLCIKIIAYIFGWVIRLWWLWIILFIVWLLKHARSKEHVI